MNYWIFVSVPFTDFNRGNMENLLKKTETSMKWAIGKRTPNRSVLNTGDKIIFYQGGEGGRMFFGTAELASGLQRVNETDSFVGIKSFELWSKTVKIKPLIDKLSFIRNKGHWGVYFQGGIAKISEKDYNLILGCQKKHD